MAATQRVDFRIDPAAKARIEQAAVVANVPVSEFVRAAAEQRADEVLSEQRDVYVSPEFFDELIAALDAPYTPNERLQRAARRLDEVVTRD